MDANEYQQRATVTAIYPEAGTGSVLAISYCALGLGEAGEVQGKVKKFIRDGIGYSDLRRQVSAEVGDVLWYCAQLCNELNLDLSDVMKENLRKLNDRKERGVLGGSGDTR